MAASIVQTSSILRTTGSGSSSTQSFSSNLTAGNTAFFIGGNYPSGFSTVSGSSSGSYTKAIGFGDGGDNFIEIWYKEDIAGGAETVTITPTSTSGNYITSFLVEASGLNTSSLLDRTGSAATTGTSHTVTASAANTQSDVLVFTAIIADVGSSSISWGTPSGYTLTGRENDSNTYTGIQVAYKIVTANETSSATATSVSLNADSVIATFKTAGASSPTGTLSVTTAADSRVITGSPVLLGTLARTDGQDNRTITGTTNILGTLARTGADDVMTASGSADQTVYGTINRIEAVSIMTASGTIVVPGSLSRTTNGDTMTASGSTGTPPINTRWWGRLTLVVRNSL
jgi:hypothetical protein